MDLKLKDLVIAPINREINYLFNYENNVQDLKHQLEKLKYTTERLQHTIDAAIKNGEEITQAVQAWRSHAEKATMVGEEIIREGTEQAHTRCFIGLCPNFKRRYQFNKIAEKQASVIADLHHKGQFESISYRPPMSQLAPPSLYKQEALPSRLLILEQVMDALKSRDSNMIGVFGMAGVGKTVLAREVYRQAIEDSLFDTVIMVVVSATPDLRQIQNQIADMLGLRLDESSMEGRAIRLSFRMRKENKILLILDDIWHRIDLEQVGIPYRNDHNGCKLLLTSRNRFALLQMGTEQNFLLEVLPEEEACLLFDMMANEATKNLELWPIATEIVRRCAGLPLLIVTVARRLRNTNRYIWIDFLNQLSGVDKREVLESVFSTTELSYKYLRGDEIKLLFLLCGLIGQSNIQIQDLLKYIFGLRLSGIMTIAEAKNRVNKWISDLKANCLLEDGEINGSVKMHDVVRDVAVSIASENQQAFVVRSDTRLKEWPDKDTLQRCTGISLSCCDVSELPQLLECPRLEFLLLHTKDHSLSIPDSFFQKMPVLKVLDISGMSFSRLPASLGSLYNLRTLCLDHCNLYDISIIRSLPSLEILTFKSSDIVQLPIEIGELHRLKLLDLSHCSKLKLIPPNVISRLNRLEELYMQDSFVGWEAGELLDRSNASLSELKCLSCLKALSIHILDAKLLPKDLFSMPLERHQILIGEVWDWHSNDEIERMLKLKLNTSIHLEPELKLLLNRTEDLYFDEVKGIKTLLYDLNIEGLPRLKHLHVQNGVEIQYIVDSVKGVSCIAFPSLRSLSLGNLMNLEKICQGPLARGSFSNLRTLIIRNCHKLKNLFSVTMIRVLLQLQQIQVADCENMVAIITEEGVESDDKNEAYELTQLRSLTLECLPKLRSFCFSEEMPPTTDPGFKDIISESDLDTSFPLLNITVPNLEDLKLSSIPCERVWHRQFSTVTSHLTSLIVECCQNLKCVFTSSMVRSGLGVKKLEICDCELMEVIVETQEFVEQWGTKKLLFPYLESLKLKNLLKVSGFYNGYDLIECPSLENLLIDNCPALKSFVPNFPSTVHRETDETDLGEIHPAEIQSFFHEKVACPHLEEMELSNIHHLENIWHNQLAPGSFFKLKTMRIKGCQKLQIVFPSNAVKTFRNLTKLWVSDCHSLELIYQLPELNGDDIMFQSTFQLRELYLSGLHKLKHIWSKDPLGIFRFHDLHSVEVYGCEVLENLFPLGIAIALPNLERLAINSCGIQEIVAKEENITESSRFMFPQLTSLELGNLPKLQSFYPEMHTLDWPVLKYLKIFGCDKLVKFSLEDIPIQLPLFVAEKVLPSLEELTLDGNDMMMIMLKWQNFFYRLKFLHLRSFDVQKEAPAALFRILQRSTKVEKLIISDSSVKELLQYESVNSNEGAFPRVRSLELNRLDDLKNIWKPDTQFHPSFQYIEILKVKFCGSLITLAPSSASFQNLTILEVSHCKGLVNLITLSVAKSMVQLEILRIKDCDMLKEIIADEQEEETTGDGIVFSKLKTLALVGLQNLTSFCLGYQAFVFPSLEQVTVANCPRLKMLSPGDMSTPQLERVLTEFPSTKNWRWEGNLNSTIEQI